MARPHPEPSEVIVSGSFNDWARIYKLKKDSTGFTGSVFVPWGSKIAYKYIVDGMWTTHPDQPTEVDHEGNVNNMYTAPPQPESTLNGSGKPAPEQAPTTTSANLPQLVAHFADTIMAREGTTSALGYVASGIGAALNTVVGVDPINAEQIAIPTPLPTPATAATEFDVPESTVSNTAPISSTSAEVASPLEQPQHDNVSSSEEPDVAITHTTHADVVSDTPLATVPVIEPENGTLSSVPGEEPIIKAKADETAEQSIHSEGVANGHAPAVIPEAPEEPDLIATSEKANEASPVAKSNKDVELGSSVVPQTSIVDETIASEEIPIELSKPLETPEAITPDSDEELQQTDLSSSTSAPVSESKPVPALEAERTVAAEDAGLATEMNEPTEPIPEPIEAVVEEPPADVVIHPQPEADTEDISTKSASEPIPAKTEVIGTTEAPLVQENAHSTDIPLQEPLSTTDSTLEEPPHPPVEVISPASASVPSSEPAPITPEQRSGLPEAPSASASEPAAATNGHAKESSAPVVAEKNRKEVFPTSTTPVGSPSKSEKTPARKKRSSIFGKIKSLFESEKDKSKK
ncbi:hypothetical protein H0H93_010347 [Arthromyces matolae]|nr:hypothetical protein H0H93_010347 [Arthromyces matolae]